MKKLTIIRKSPDINVTESLWSKSSEVEIRQHTISSTENLKRALIIAEWKITPPE